MKHYKVTAISVGKPTILETEKGKVDTAFRKKKVDEPVYLGRFNFSGDLQADQQHHGGVDKAVCLYPARHYAHWETIYGRIFLYPSFGENLTVEDLDEKQAAIGDIYTLGEAEVQVTQPRQPCYKISRNHGIDDFPAKVMETGFTGFYLRVLKEGRVHPDDLLTLKKKDPEAVTIEEVNDVKYHDKNNRSKIKRILSVPALADSLRASLQGKL
ncbi:MOSC domain-containing protein [Thalassobacillus pellis]|uniref:MOSC domain-containing protein n=1 Tax=Thalassobacillus pellis TaxID=748008 RepID=UPI0019616CFF|nr:MOSC domain-containing protein [Thalassobacillus pellis]MBM7553680.1 MOSC domain-containing protein YiiM [Thalassobacillus pellis]